MSVAAPDNDALIAVYDREARRLRTEWSAGADSATHSDKFIDFHTPYLPKNGGHALDIGAGYGAHIHGLEERGLTVVAVEPAAGMRVESQRIEQRTRVVGGGFSSGSRGFVGGGRLGILRCVTSTPTSV